MASYTNYTPVADKTTSYIKYTPVAAEMADIVKQAERAQQSSLKEKKAAELALEWVRAKLAEDTKESEARTAFVTRFYRPAIFKLCLDTSRFNLCSNRHKYLTPICVLKLTPICVLQDNAESTRRSCKCMSWCWMELGKLGMVWISSQ